MISFLVNHSETNDAASNCNSFKWDFPFLSVFFFLHNSQMILSSYSLKTGFILKQLNNILLCDSIGYQFIFYQTLFGNTKLVGSCFEPSQPQGIISGLETNINPSPTYSAQKPQNSSKSSKSVLPQI